MKFQNICILAKGRPKFPKRSKMKNISEVFFFYGTVITLFYITFWWEVTPDYAQGHFIPQVKVTICTHFTLDGGMHSMTLWDMDSKSEVFKYVCTDIFTKNVYLNYVSLNYHENFMKNMLNFDPPNWWDVDITLTILEIDKLSTPSSLTK